MYNSLFPTKDNTITNAVIDGVAHSSSNSGISEIIELYHLTESLSTYGNSRILMQFDLTNHSQSIVSGDIPTSSVEYRLRFKNSFHHETLPSSFDIFVFPLSRSWDENVGLSMFDEDLKDTGLASNWNNATSLVSWSITGSDFVSSSNLTASQHFDHGYEDLNINISNIVYAWLTGSLPNHGLLIKFGDAYETSSIDFYIKKFYSRHAHVPERRPRLEILWPDIKQDDRLNMKYNSTGSLYFYNFKKGKLQNISNPVFINILNSSSTVVQTITASNVETGIYLASGAIVSFTSSTQIFRDIWFSGTNQYFTGTFIPQFDTGSFEYSYAPVDISLPNLKPIYKQDERIFIKVEARKKNYAPAVRITASTDLDAVYLAEAWYSIINYETEEVIINFSTGSNEYSRLSYDKNGNYFNFWASGLVEKSVYKIKILTNYNDQKIVFDKGWIFKIEG